MKHKFKVSYDEEGDVLTIFKDGAEVKESIEVTEDMVIDVDKDRNMVNLEFMDAFKFLHTVNEKITKEMLGAIDNLELDVKQFRNNWIITMEFKYNDEVILEKLPVFANSDFKSPLVASAAA